MTSGVLDAAAGAPPARTSGGPTASDSPVVATVVAPEAGETLELWQRRLARARAVLDTYVTQAQYPFDSRPISEKPDLLLPYRGVPMQVPLRGADGTVALAGALELRQDRFNVVGDEGVHLFLSCAQAGNGEPCAVAMAEARVASAEQAARFPGVPVAFADNGLDGDAVASDGIFTTHLVPARQGFTGYHGYIETGLQVRLEGKLFAASFMILYTPVPPARFTGKVRERLAAGSLDLMVELDVHKPGHYLVHGRVDDALGRSFAFLAFNDQLEAGLREVPLQLFGKLVLDQNAQAPFTLRDIDGHLLLEDADPDRELMLTLAGAVHRTAAYPRSSFSEAVWDSEEKQRYVTEFSKDVAQAEAAVARLGGRP
ncbi:MAG: hypothetical protein IT370_08845 [Deltaproteobacteria bacterium]|nr:hypothetical protein [Deltaproteobacteria bacterium]